MNNAQKASILHRNAQYTPNTKHGIKQTTTNEEKPAWVS